MFDPNAYPEFTAEYTSKSIVRNRVDSLFEDIGENDFRLDSLSVAMGKARYLFDVPTDLLNVSRDLSNPDLGCFEKQ